MNAPKTIRYFILICLSILPIVSTAHSKATDYSAYLKHNSTEPTEFVLSKLKSHRIVAIGEDHWIADHTPFFCEILRKASMSDDTRPDIIALEFGNELDQGTADRVAYSDTFLADSVIKILQHAPDIYGNPYKEYFDVFKCIWEVNRSLPKEKKNEDSPFGPCRHTRPLQPHPNAKRD